MRRVLKWIGITLGSVLGLLLLVVAIMAILAGSRLNRDYDIQPQAVTITNDSAVVAHGQYLYSINCAGCHSDDLGGTPFFDDPAIGTVPASNLTAGQGGVGARYDDMDYLRAIRHGVDDGGKPLLIMPSQAFWHFSDNDVAAIIAYIKSAPSIYREWEEKRVNLMGRVLISAGALDSLAAEHINHTGSPPPAPVRGVSAANGEYLVNTGDCRLCHGANLSGAQPPEPGAPVGPNLTPGGVAGSWSDNEFINTMRTGVTPDGRSMDATFMPWEDISRMTDDDLTAVYLYLQSLPALESAVD